DLAAARDRAPGLWRRRIYGIFALGWRGSSNEWRHYRVAYTLLAGLATPLVISVHSIVSLDFAITQLPGWHSTIFPPYFVVGAIYSGLAMVLLLILPARRVFRLDNIITMAHLSNIAKLMLATGSMLAYSYMCEAFMAWYSGDPYEHYAMLVARPLGPYAVVFWLMLFANVVTPQIFWWKRMRTSVVALFIVSLFVFAGMWCERCIIIVGSLNRDFLPSSWHFYAPTWVDLSLLFGSIGLFCFLFLAFLRWVPMVPVHGSPGRVLGEFTTAESMLAAVDALLREGYRTLETFTPFDMPELDDRLGLRRSRIGWLVAAGGFVGMVLAYGVQWWANVHDYPLNSGGRPVHAVPAFLLATFEGTVLFAAFAAFFGLMIWLRLPKLWAPIDEVDGF